MPAVVDPEKCEGCGDCISSCATNAIVMEEDKAKVKPEDCCECNACIDQCPTHAISMQG